MSGWATHWARTPATSGPTPMPPRLAAVETIWAREARRPGAPPSAARPARRSPWRSPCRRRGRRRSGRGSARAGRARAGRCPRWHAEEQRRREQPAAAVPVGEVADGEQADHHADRVGGEDHRQRERREPVALLVDRVQRGGDRVVGKDGRNAKATAQKPKPCTIRSLWAGQGRARRWGSVKEVMSPESRAAPIARNAELC